MYYIYKHENLINGKVYIGQTCQEPTKRWRSDGKGYKHCTKFYNAIKKYGWDNFSHEILYSSEYEGNIDWMEKMFINEYHSTDSNFGYNLESGGSLNKHVSDETRKKLSESHKGIKYSEDRNKKISLSNSKPVLQYSINGEFIKEWIGLHEAGRELGIRNNHISECCNNKRKTCGGFIWRYKDE